MWPAAMMFRAWLYIGFHRRAQLTAKDTPSSRQTRTISSPSSRLKARGFSAQMAFTPARATLWTISERMRAVVQTDTMSGFAFSSISSKSE